jgi:hypothetical protein
VTRGRDGGGGVGVPFPPCPPSDPSTGLSLDQRDREELRRGAAGGGRRWREELIEATHGEISSCRG